MKSENKKKLKGLLNEIQWYAKEIKKALRKGSDITNLSSQLVAKQTTYVFALGESFSSLTKKDSNDSRVKAGVKSASTMKRDEKGRFIKA